jgi:PHD/YefM family antitoxin component YafN of YafNO toxin-antitoxin module
MDTSLLRRQKFTNVQTVQAGVSKLFEKASQEGSFYQVLRNGDEPLGILIPQQVWEDWLEDEEAQASNKYRERIAVSRKDTTRVTSTDTKKRLGV